MSDTLTRLAQVLEERKGAAADSSYVASLYLSLIHISEPTRPY